MNRAVLPQRRHSEAFDLTHDGIAKWLLNRRRYLFDRPGNAAPEFYGWEAA